MEGATRTRWWTICWIRLAASPRRPMCVRIDLSKVSLMVISGGGGGRGGRPVRRDGPRGALQTANLNGPSPQEPAVSSHPTNRAAQPGDIPAGRRQTPHHPARIHPPHLSEQGWWSCVSFFGSLTIGHQDEFLRLMNMPDDALAARIPPAVSVMFLCPLPTAHPRCWMPWNMSSPRAPLPKCHPPNSVTWLPDVV